MVKRRYTLTVCKTQFQFLQDRSIDVKQSEHLSCMGLRLHITAQRAAANEVCICNKSNSPNFFSIPQKAHYKYLIFCKRKTVNKPDTVFDKQGTSEKLEAGRYASFLKKDGKIVVNTQQIDPMPVIIGAAEYPENVLDELTDKGVSVDALDALSLAEEAGSSKAVNIVLMGKASKYFDIPYESWIKAIENTVAPKFVEMNKKAFELGYNS